MKHWKLAVLGSAAALLLSFAVYWGWRSYERHARLMAMVELVSSKPDGLHPGVLVGKIDESYMALPEDEKRRISADPKLLSERIETASYNNYKQAFGELFMLPGPIRRKAIQSAADAIDTALNGENKEKTDAFYESDAGKAALRAATRYFLLDLNGSQKAELKPITDAFFKIHQDRATRGKY